MATKIQLRRDTSANWTSVNPVLSQGEPGYETDTGKIKYGDGSSHWSALSYSAGSSAGGSGAQGPQGPQGLQGPQGPQGIMGYTGSSGAGGSSIGGSANQVVYKNNSNTATGSANLTFDGTNLSVNGNITAGGTITAFSTSDSKLKTNIEIITDALYKVYSLDGVTFNWNELAVGQDQETRELGVIAQQVQQILPEAVKTRNDGYLGVRYESMIPLLIQAVKELGKSVESKSSTNYFSTSVNLDLINLNNDPTYSNDAAGTNPSGYKLQNIYIGRILEAMFPLLPNAEASVLCTYSCMGGYSATGVQVRKFKVMKIGTDITKWMPCEIYTHESSPYNAFETAVNVVPLI